MKPTSLRPKEQSMTLEQINEEMKKKQTKRNIIKKTLDFIERMRKDIDGPLWAHVREKCNTMLSGVDALEDRSDEYDPAAHPIPDRVIWKALGVRKAARVLLAIGKMMENEEGYSESLIKVEKEIKELEQRKLQLGSGK